VDEKDFFVFLVSDIYVKWCQGAFISNRHNSGVAVITGIVIGQKTIIIINSLRVLPWNLPYN
jgi:hypothetical protein